MTDTVEIWERIEFFGPKAISWERSFDHGQTWEPIGTAYDAPPFILLKGDEDLGPL